MWRALNIAGVLRYIIKWNKRGSWKVLGRIEEIADGHWSCT